MKYLIVNGDDFGASRGINRGIMEAHKRGILTSTSLIVNMSSSEEAAWLSRDLPRLSVGLHVNFANSGGEPLVDPADPDTCRAELHRQFYRFQELMGYAPTHLDSHHNAYRDPRLLPLFLDLARQYQLPLREHCPVRYFSKFYGQWDGVSHLEQISVESLARMLETEVQDGCTELSCHPGYIDAEFQSSYSVEREAELRTLCDPSIREALVKQQIQLVSYRDLGSILMNLSS
ncbi:MAG: carbohydrate deacetylase [Blastocatellia bacterium]